MIAAYLDAMRRYVVFEGRTSRGGYWWYALALAILQLAALGIDALLLDSLNSEAAPFFGLVLLAHVLPSLAIIVRRLHDTDRSGWFVLIELIPIVGIIILLVWFCERGTPGPNRFGGDPLGDSTALLPHATLAGSPTRVASPLAAAMRDVIAEVERLAHLRASGSLSEAEFAALKAQVMAGTGRA